MAKIAISNLNPAGKEVVTSDKNQFIEVSYQEQSSVIGGACKVYIITDDNGKIIARVIVCPAESETSV